MGNLSKNLSLQKRHHRLRKQVSGTPEKPRLVVTRTNANLFVQIVDDTTGHTLVSASTYKINGSKADQAKSVGESVAKQAKAKHIQEVVFDRGGHKYHGRVKLVAESAREGGLTF